MNRYRAILAIAIGIFNASAAAADSPQAAIVTVQAAAPKPQRTIEGLRKIVEARAGVIVITGPRGDGFSDDHQLLALDDTSIIWAKLLRSTPIENIVASGSGGVFAHIIWRSEQERRTGVGKRPGAVHFGPDGEILWAHVLGSKLPIIISGLAPGPDGGLYLSGHIVVTPGQSYSNGTRPGRQEALVVRLDALGRIVWAKALDTLPDAGPIKAASTPDGGVIVGRNQLWRLDRDGNPLWSVRVTIDALGGVIHNTVAAGGGVIVGGDVFRPGRAGTDAVAISIDGSGILRWARAVDVGATDRIEDASPAPDGGVILAGSTRRMGPRLEDKVYEMEGWLVELDRDGNLRRSVAVGSGIVRGGQLGDFINAASSAQDRSIIAVGTLHSGRDFASQAVFLRLPAGSDGTSSTCSLIKPAAATTASISAELTPVPAHAKDFALEIAPFEPDFGTISSSLAKACPE